MQCAIHPTREGVNTCCECGTWLCDGCTVEAGNRLFCRNCLKRAIEGSGAKEYAVLESCCPERRHINKFLLFVCSLILPGVNYMYEGLIKRGLFAMTSFFVLVSVAAVLHMPILGVLIAILWITTFFDGFHIARKLNSGICVEDGIEDIILFIKRNRAAVIVMAVVFLVLGFLSGNGYAYPRNIVYYTWRYSQSNGVIPLLLLAVGIYFLVRMFGRPGRKHVRKTDETYPGDGSDGMNR